MTTSRGRAWLAMLAVCGVVLALDQGIKAVIVNSLAPGERVDLVLGFDLTRITNSGIAFGLLENAGNALVLTITGVALLLVLGWFAADPLRPELWLGVGLLLGGAVGNLVDRLRLDAVTDFLDPPLWPAFNVADVSITVGVIVVALAALAPRDPEPARP